MEGFLYQVFQGLRTFFWFKGFSIFWEFLICIIVGNSGSMPSTPVVSGNHSVALCASMACHRLGNKSVSWCLETSLLKTLFPGWVSLPKTELPPHLLCLFSHLLYFFLPVFEDNDLLFWVPDVLYQHSEAVLWSLLSFEMFFWGICEGETGLPILFLRHLRTAPQGLFKWVSSSHQVAKVLELQLQHQSFQWTLRADLL